MNKKYLLFVIALSGCASVFHSDIHVAKSADELSGCKLIGKVRGHGYKTSSMERDLRKSTKEIGGNVVLKLPQSIEDVGLEGAPHTIWGKAYSCNKEVAASNA